MGSFGRMIVMIGEFVQGARYAGRSYDEDADV